MSASDAEEGALLGEGQDGRNGGPQGPPHHPRHPQQLSVASKRRVGCGSKFPNAVISSSPPTRIPPLTPYPLPALKHHKPLPSRKKKPYTLMGRPYARGQCYPLMPDTYNNNNHLGDELLLGDVLEPSSSASTQRGYLNCFAVSFVFLFFLFLLYLPVYHQVQVREAPIPGWARNSSRDLSLYVLPNNLTALIEQPEICGKPDSPLLLLVIICSAVGNFDARQAIRDTWGSPSNLSRGAVKVAFLLGASSSEELQIRVEGESLEYSDVIQEGFLDTYNNLTLKSVMLLKWVRSHCQHARYVMKTDDDMFVNLDRLVTQLRTDAARFRPPSHSIPPDLASEPRTLLLGALICGARPIANTRSKWYAPRYMYSERTYPNYLSGTGYVMSADVVRRLFKSALHTPLFHLEDVYITGMCARAAGIRPRDHPGFSYQRKKLEPCAYRDSLITSHRLNSTDLRQVWQRMHAPGLQCPTSSGATTVSKVRKGGRASTACV